MVPDGAFKLKCNISSYLTHFILLIEHKVNHMYVVHNHDIINITLLMYFVLNYALAFRYRRTAWQGTSCW